MAHDYGVPLKIVSITITRDNEAAPSSRLPDKHSRIFCGKTLDEWTMLQVWSSQCLTKKVFVCETNEHANKLKPMADKYGIELMVRPEQMLHPLNDSGAIPCVWAFQEIMKNEYFSLLTNPFVVTPCRPPGFFDEMALHYQKQFGNPDWIREAPYILGGYNSDHVLYEIDEHGRGKQQGTIYINRVYAQRATKSNHWLGAAWWYLSQLHIVQSRHDPECHPVIWDIEPWMDCHIDTEDDWKEAEFWFKEKILSKGADCYEHYRRTWHD